MSQLELHSADDKHISVHNERELLREPCDECPSVLQFEARYFRLDNIRYSIRVRNNFCAIATRYRSSLIFYEMFKSQYFMLRTLSFAIYFSKSSVRVNVLSRKIESLGADFIAIFRYTFTWNEIAIR